MSAQIKVTLADIKMLAGVKGIDILVDEAQIKSIDFGETVALEVSPGTRKIKMLLHGVVERKSNTLEIDVAEGEQVCVHAKYSRLWGNIKLRTG